MRKLLLISVFTFLFIINFAQDSNPYQRYIRRYAAIAVEEMYRSGVPASITLAQGILESGCGQSYLALKANNHFGIKCHEWTGPKVFRDDDAKNECFRSYPDPEESFKDHSDFLRYRDRYKFLFDLPTGDYKSWAFGLKKAGYATNPKYAQQLIKYIEDYNLSRFDTMSLDSAVAISMDEEKHLGQKRFYKYPKNSPKVIPPSPLSLEQAHKYEGGSSERISYNLSRNIYVKNSVPFIIFRDGDNLDNLADQYNLFPSEIRKYNDVTNDAQIKPGDAVYIEAKRNEAEKGLDKYIVGEKPESLRDISQRFAVKLSSILKMNHISKDFQPREGDCILLRKNRTTWF